MDRKEEQMLQQAANARLVHLNEQLVFPLLERNADAMLTQVCQELKLGGMPSIAKLAYIAACRDLTQELKAIAMKGDRAVIRLDEHRSKES